MSIVGNYLPQNPIILEAGASDGESTLMMLQLWPQSRIYAFEPFPRAYQILEQNTRLYTNVSRFPMALGNKVGVTDFYISRHPNSYQSSEEDPGYSSSILSPFTSIWNEPNVKFEEIIQVPITILDLWAEEHKIDKIDFMWLDMQGAEGLMLEASPKILKTVKVIQTEYSNRQFYEGTMVFEELHYFMAKNGFKLIAYTEGECGDAWYVRI